MKVAQKVAIVTGGGGGIGGAVAKKLAAQGARVVVADLDAEAAARVADSLNANFPDSAVAAFGDVSDVGVIEGLIVEAEEAFGPVDLYFANAGITGGLGLDVDEEAWDIAFDINVRAHIRAARLLVPGWIARGEGYFVSTASAAGLLTQVGSAVYSVTKHAAVGFAEWLSVTYRDKGIRVSCMCPMGVDTKLLFEGRDSGDPLGEIATNAVLAAGEVITPDQCAEIVLAAIEDEHFLVLPHPKVLEMYRQKGADYDRWLSGMSRYQASLLAGTR